MIAALFLAAALTVSQPLDAFEALAPWRADASDGVTAGIASVPGATGRAMRLSYDFGRVSGYAYARRTLPIKFPANYRLTLKVRGTGGVNDLQIKFVDASGQNVWWHQRRNFRASGDWQTIRLRPQDLSFAWGPTADKALRATASVEIVVVRGRDGGRGTLEVDDLALEPLPLPAALPAPVASDRRVLDRNATTGWTGRGGDALLLDFGGVKPIGGATLEWASPAPAYTMEASDDRRHWHMLRRVTRGDGGTDPIALADTETRYLRVRLPPGAPLARLAEITVQPPDWAATPNAFITSLAQAAPRGSFPRGFSGEQPYWTLVGTDGGAHSGLIGEDGPIEVAKGGFSIEPFVVDGDRTISWADVKPAQSLEDGYLPLPHIVWNAPGWRLDTALFADVGQPRLMARWRLTNTGTAPRRLRLLLAVRPFQVNPPAQFLGQPGGVSPISRIVWADGKLAVTTPPTIEGDPPIMRTLRPLVLPTSAAAAPFDQGALTVSARAGPPSVDDPTALASATLAYDRLLAPGESIDVPMTIPFDGAGSAIDGAAFEAAHRAAVASWRGKLDRVRVTVPPAKQPIADTLRTSLAHVLMSRDGAQLKPGTRSYDRSWIRDGAMMADTLLRLGQPEPARAFADWYGGKLFANGKVPCCVDARGADPVPENDSAGEYIHLVTQLYRFTRDRAALARDWPRLDAARRHMEGLRQSERTAANRDHPERYGLMPPSISHEGYSSQPQYSLWDDFWALTGYKDATYAAQILARPEATAIATQRDRFAADLHAAIRASVARFGIDFIPGATSLGDFDATSTTIALDPAGEQAALDPVLLRATFDRQYGRVMARTAPGADWTDYTPYEWRNVSALVRLGERRRANELITAYMADRRPAAWNGWAEVVGRLPREVRFIGDMPHAWVASDFIRAALDLFAYERAGALVLGAGLTDDWLSGGGSAIRGLHTPYGILDLAIRADPRRVVVEVAGDARPPAGFILPWPLATPPGRASVDGRPVVLASDGFHLAATGSPIRVVIDRR